MTTVSAAISAWDDHRSNIEQILGKTLDEESWRAIQSLPLAAAPELLWRLRDLHAQLPAAGKPILFQPIRPQPSPAEAKDRACGLCGNPLPQTLTAAATQRFRCEWCAIAARLLLGHPVLYEGSRESLPTLPA